jgi:glucose-6-phosphate isomerase
MMHAPNLFSSDPSRFAKFSAKFEDLLVDYSKNAASAETMDLLRDLAAEADVLGKARPMCSGERINNTEGQAVLHVVLHNQ